jgi:hypothetical protein
VYNIIKLSQNSEDDLMTGADKRRSVRVQKNLEIQYWTDGLREQGRISDIGPHGVFIDTNNPLDPGTLLHFSFRLIDDPLTKPVEGTCKVIWTQPMLGMGVEFQDLSPVHRGRIKYFVEAEASKVPAS